MYPGLGGFISPIYCRRFSAQVHSGRLKNEKNLWDQGIDGPLTILRCIFCCSLILRWSYASGDYVCF